MSLILGSSLEFIKSLSKIFTGLDSPRLLTANISHNEISARTGLNFNMTQQFVVNASTPLYVLFENPIESTANVELIERFFQTDSDGAELLILWDYDVTGATKTTIIAFNSNNKYRDTIQSSLSISVLNAVTVNAATGVATISSAYTPISQGVIREPSSIVASGVGSNRSGSINSNSGARIYKTGTGYLVKITSLGNGNKITLGYTWQENKD